jgi:signal peptidase I
VSPSLRKLLPQRKARAAEPEREPAPVQRESGARAGWRRFRRATDRYRLLTDVLGALIMVAIVVGGIAAATGGVWPPVVIVESGSMMHAIQETEYGRFGTIDVGDMVFIRAVRDPSQITTWADGSEVRYGRPGDVIAYAPNGNFSATPVIHRAIAYIQVSESIGVGAGNRALRNYELHWVDGEVLYFDSRGIYFPPLGFDENWGFYQSNGFKPAYSGYVTKGDNAFSNPASDQAIPNRDTPISALIEPAWIIGEVYGEVPWIGLGKLALQSGQTNPEVPGWERVGNAFAPLELWTMFFLCLTLIILVPLTLDTIRTWRTYRHEQETTRRLEEENRKRLAERRAAAAAAGDKKKVTTFAAVVSSRPLAQPVQRRPPPPGP